MAGVAGVMLMTLAGCSGARVSNLASVSSHPVAPTEILVEVDAPAVQPAQTAEANATTQTIVATLGTDLVQHLAKAGIIAAPYTSTSERPGVAVLQVTVTQADGGNRLKRLLIGFGAGQARLSATADLLTKNAQGATSLLAFDTYSDSGRKPGLVVPGGAVLAGGRAIGLAIGGAVDIGGTMHGGLDAPATKTANAITGQLKAYYALAEWPWPTAT